MTILTTRFFVANSSSTFSIFHQNIQGLLSKREVIEITLSQLPNPTSPDVLCFTETFVKKGDEKYINIKNYNLAACYTRESKRGGACILLRDGLLFQNITFGNNIATDFILEYCAISVKNLNLIIVCLYRIPTTKKKNIDSFFEKLELLLHTYMAKYPKKKIVIAGDFNINTLIDTNNTVRLKEILKTYQLTSHITEPTRDKSCIDLIISNIEKAVGSVMPLLLSDHDMAQMLNFPVSNKHIIPTKVIIYKRCYNNEYVNKFRQYLSQISFSHIECNSNLNSAFEEFHTLFCTIYNLCFPLKKITIKRSHKLSNWVTKGLRKSCKTNRTYRYKYYTSKSRSDKIKYRDYNKLLKTCIAKAKRYSNNRTVLRSKNKCKATWNVITSETTAKKTREHINEIVYENDIIKDPRAIATIFNNYLIDRTNFADSKVELPNVQKQSNSMYLTPVDAEIVEKIIMSLNSTQSVGYDGITTNVLKECRKEISPVLARLINLSFETGTFPEKLKLSIVKPLHKKGDKKNVANYRPLVLSPVFAKIFEKAMHLKLMSFFKKHNTIKQAQFGFQNGKSTSQAMFYMVNEILQNINKRKHASVLLLDMTSAFDLVLHDRLLYKLEYCGIRGPALKWLQSYLSERLQSVEISYLDSRDIIQASRSPIMCNPMGVPQGSVLGPLLFLIYINDLPDILTHKTILFADDVSVIIATNQNSTLDDHNLDILNTLTLVNNWLTNNNLVINLTKTNLINFNNLKNGHISLNFNNQIINIKNEALFLGIVVDSKLNWHKHTDNVCNKVNSFSYALYKLVRVASKETALVAYYAYVESVLRYGIIVWGNSVGSKKVFIAQKRCVRALVGIAPDISCKPYFLGLGILTLASLYILEIGKFVKLNYEIFTEAKDYYTTNTRNPHRLVLTITPKTTCFQKNCYAMCIRIYNKIPEYIKELPYTRFKITLRKWLLQNVFYTIDEFFNNQPECI